MALCRSKLQRTIDRANSRVAGCEMSLRHSFTPEAIERSEAELAAARDWLARAEAAEAAWNAAPHGDYDEEPDVSEFPEGAPVNLLDAVRADAAIRADRSRLGAEAYAASVAARPTYHDGTPRPAWDELSPIARGSWERAPREMA